MQYFVRLLSSGSAETDNEWGAVIWWPVVSGIFLTKLIVSGSLFFKLWWKKNLASFFMPHSGRQSGIQKYKTPERVHNILSTS